MLSTSSSFSAMTSLRYHSKRSLRSLSALISAVSSATDRKDAVVAVVVGSPVEEAPNLRFLLWLLLLLWADILAKQLFLVVCGGCIDVIDGRRRSVNNIAVASARFCIYRGSYQNGPMGKKQLLCPIARLLRKVHST